MRARGEKNIPRDTAKLAERAFQTTSDFPLLLSAAANKMLLAAYAPANPTYRQIFLRRDFRDFKPHLKAAWRELTLPMIRRHIGVSSSSDKGRHDRAGV